MEAGEGEGDEWFVKTCYDVEGKIEWVRTRLGMEGRREGLRDGKEQQKQRRVQ